MLKRWQWISIGTMMTGVTGIGAHLFLFDGINNPTIVLTVFSCLFGLGMAGQLITALLLFCQEIKRRKEAGEPVFSLTRHDRKDLAAAMLMFGIAFIIYALVNPETSFLWPNAVTWVLDSVYMIGTICLFIL